MAEKDAFANNTGTFTLSATAPAASVDTIYTRLGDIFAWICGAAMAAVLALAWLHGERRPRTR